jgi:hypothetical protein
MVRALGWDGQRDAILAEVGKVWRDSLTAKDRFNAPDWQARQRAAEAIQGLIGPATGQVGSERAPLVQVTMVQAPDPSAPRPLVIDVPPADDDDTMK